MRTAGLRATLARSLALPFIPLKGCSCSILWETRWPFCRYTCGQLVRDGHLRCSSVDGTDYCSDSERCCRQCALEVWREQREEGCPSEPDSRARALAIELEIVRYSVSLRYESISELWEMRGQVRSAAIGESGGAEQWDNSRRRHNESHYLLDMSQFCCCAKERAPTLLPLWLS